MWLCGKCGEQSEDNFDVCWKCGAGRDGQPNPDFVPVPDASRVVDLSAAKSSARDPLVCPRCTSALAYVGRKRFHEGTNWGFFGELGELFVKREHFDVYVCPRCGRVEMFVDGIGEDLRHEPS